MSVCLHCAPKKFLEQFHPKPKQGHLPRKQPFFELGCGHIFTVTYLDEYVQHSNGTIMPKQCPKCHQNIAVGLRYGNAIRRAQTDATNVREIEREWQKGGELSHVTLAGDFTRGHFDFMRIQRMLAVSPNCSGKRCLAECVETSYSLYLTLQSHMKDNPDISSISSHLRKVVSTLVNSATSEPTSENDHMRAAALLVPEKRKSPKLNLTFQLLGDFTSELYHMSLRAQCLIARSRTPTLWSVMTTRFTGSRYKGITNAERYLDSLDPLKDRITEEKYEDYFRQITAAVPDVASLHVQTPQVPPVVKGTWTKCQAGHYYCTPPKCGTDFKVALRCPDCL